MIQKFMRKNNKGFTLVELMVVVAILGVLVAIAIPVYSNVTASAKTAADKANVRTINGAIEVYRAANGSITALEGSVNSSHHLVADGYLKEAPADPWGGTRTYTIASGSATELGTPTS